MKQYFYGLLVRYLSLFIRPEDSVSEVDPKSSFFSNRFPGYKRFQTGQSTDYIILNGTIHYERDVQVFLEELKGACSSSTRVIFLYYSMLWKPLLRLASSLGMRSKDPEQNWISHEDVTNFLKLADYEPVCVQSRILLPVWIPVISGLINRYLAPLPFFRTFCMVNILVVRPLGLQQTQEKPSVSVVVAARNEEGNIEDIFRRLPKMGPDDELILVEGNSTDNTWGKILEVSKRYKDKLNVVTARQDGKGKGDAVRKGFSLATKDILMILDADLTVPPEDLPKFYQAILRDKGEFINGSRLVYPMEKEAMRFCNLLGNKFFALAFSFVLGQDFKDTLCGTKVLSRANYEKLAAHRNYFGDFDPFGDFDLIFGAARMGLKIIELPISYRQRNYGTTNIERWKHGVILLRMLVFAAKRIKFI